MSKSSKPIPVAPPILPAPQCTDLAPVERSRAELASEALDYRKQGFGYASIADQMGVPVPDVVALVSEAIQASGIDLDPETTRRLDIERLDQMISAIMSDASGGDINAIGTVRALMGDRQRIETRGMPSIADMFRYG
jgi:hypothetical protein